MAKKKNPREIAIQDLYSNATPEQLEQAKYTLALYLKNALAIYENILADSNLYKKFKQAIAKRKKPLKKSNSKGKKIKRK